MDFLSSSILSEVWKSQAFRRLVFSSLTYACEDQYDDSYDVRQHLVQFLDRHVAGRHEQMEDIESTEDDGAEDREVRLP